MFHISLALLRTSISKCHYVDEWLKEQHKILERNPQQKGPVWTWFLEKYSIRMRTGFGWLSLATPGGLFKAQQTVGVQRFSKKSGRNQKMLAVWMLKCSKSHSEGPQASCVTV
jgi:hypothetical protein